MPAAPALSERGRTSLQKSDEKQSLHEQALDSELTRLAERAGNRRSQWETVVKARLTSKEALYRRPATGTPCPFHLSLKRFLHSVPLATTTESYEVKTRGARAS